MGALGALGKRLELGLVITVGKNIRDMEKFH